MSRHNLFVAAAYLFFTISVFIDTITAIPSPNCGLPCADKFTSSASAPISSPTAGAANIDNTTMTLNTTAVLQTNASGSESDSRDITCFAPTNGTTLYNTSYLDCIEVIDAMMDEKSLNDSVRWSSDGRNGSLVPHTWSYYNSTCEIQIQPEAGVAMVGESFPLVDVVDLAAEVAEACIVRSGPRLGGTAKLGEMNEVQLVLRGRPRPTNGGGAVNATVVAGNLTEYVG